MEFTDQRINFLEKEIKKLSSERSLEAKQALLKKTAKVLVDNDLGKQCIKLKNKERERD